MSYKNIRYIKTKIFIENLQKQIYSGRVTETNDANRTIFWRSVGMQFKQSRNFFKKKTSYTYKIDTTTIVTFSYLNNVKESCFLL